MHAFQKAVLKIMNEYGHNDCLQWSGAGWEVS